MRTCSFVRSIEIPLWVEGCAHPKGMASAAPSRDLELVKPAGLHFVEEKSRVTFVLPGNSHQIHVFTRPVHGFSRPIHIFPTQHTSFPVHYPTVTKLMSLWWDMLAGYVRE